MIVVDISATNINKKNLQDKLHVKARRIIKMRRNYGDLEERSYAPMRSEREKRMWHKQERGVWREMEEHAKEVAKEYRRKRDYEEAIDSPSYYREE